MALLLSASRRSRALYPAMVACAALLTLSACGEKPAPLPQAEHGAAAERPDAEDVAAPAALRDPDELIGAASVALANDRLFSPPGDNALELLLQVAEADPGHRRAQAGLVDILPFVLIGLEQRLSSGDLDETERLLGLFRRADARHPALARLESRIETARQEQANADSSRLAAEAERERRETLARQAAASPAPSTAQASGSEDSRSSPTAMPFVNEAEQTAAASPAPAAALPAASSVSPPAAATPVSPAATTARVVTSTLPPIVNQVAPRYPAQAQRRRLEGQVEVEFTIAANGSVSAVRVVRSEPAGVFDREAVGAMQRWRFAPTGQDVVGRRVFDFKLGES